MTVTLWRPAGSALPPVPPLLADKQVFVTGAHGSVGQELVALLEDGCRRLVATDRREYDVTIGGPFGEFDVVFHLAGAKHAPDGEVDPWETVLVNTVGTRNVLAAAGAARVVLASTCKACDPETAYGASKLIAERMVLNASGSVARFYNVVETSGNVFETWRAASGPLPVTDCRRYFMSVAEAASLLVWAAVLPPGRYVRDPGFPRSMAGVAADLYPGRAQAVIPRRRGDRAVEPLLAAHESVSETEVAGLYRVESPHDP